MYTGPDPTHITFLTICQQINANTYEEIIVLYKNNLSCLNPVLEKTIINYNLLLIRYELYYNIILSHDEVDRHITSDTFQ